MGSESRPSIVVGVDGSAGSERALRWAAQEARQRHGTLRVVLAWEPAYLATYSPVTAHADRGEQERAARSLLADTLRSVFGTDTPESVLVSVVQGVAERVLVAESGLADLLVLGSTPGTGRAARPVGPVIRGCLNRARCPVMIIGPCEAATREAAPAQPAPAQPVAPQPALTAS